MLRGVKTCHKASHQDCATGMRKDTQINGREVRVQKQTRIYGQLTSNKDAKTIPRGTEQSF